MINRKRNSAKTARINHRPDLTKREQEIYDLMVLEGLAFKEVAERLTISHTTVNSHIDTIYLKKNVNCRADLIFKHYKEKEESK